MPARYNEGLSFRRSIAFVCALLLGCLAPAQAERTANSTSTIIVMPFENGSGAPGLQWISEAFPEILSQRLSSPSIYALTREDRLRAYDRAGIPAQVQPTHATIYRLVEQMDADYVILGRYSFDGRSFSASAELLDMHRLKLLSEPRETGPLPELINIQTALAWDLLHSLRPNVLLDKQAYTSSAPPIRLDALEHYVRGITAATTAEKIQHFREAVRFSPNYNEALLRLGRAYFDDRQYDQAVATFAQVSTSDPLAREANFYLGLAAYYLGDFSRSQAAFNFVAARLPLPEVYNNLGVVTGRLGDKKQSANYLQKAVQADSSDADYNFNLAVALAQNGERQDAIHFFNEYLRIHPEDTEAHILVSGLTDSTRPSKLPLQRLKPTYGENSFRQLFLGIEAAAEERLSKTDALTHAQFHVSHGQELLSQGFSAEAQKEFREAIVLNSANAEAHAGLARTLELDNDLGGARTEAEAALGLKVFIDPLLLLARLDLRDNRADAAARSVDRALQLDPANSSALNLKRAVAAKLAEKAQPLPN